jgi:O-antigen/teichoic acid export membrane protein
MASDVKLSRWSLLKGVGTTVGAYGAGRVVRLAGSITLARLLSPELFGIIAIVNSIRTGIDLISDVGVAQSIIQNKNGENPEFYNSGWTLKAVRGATL